MEYHILIVDEHPGLTRQLLDILHGLDLGSARVQVLTVRSAAAAQLQATRQHYHLLIAALRQHNGFITLIKNLQTISPRTQTLLFCDTASRALVAAYVKMLQTQIIDGRMSREQIRARIQTILCALPSEDEPTAQPSSSMSIESCLQDVLHQSSATLVMLTDHLGHVIAQQGAPSQLDIAAMTSLVAGSFVNGIELGQMLRDPDTVHYGVHEGRYFNVYSASMSADRILIFVFDRAVAAPKIGAVLVSLRRGVEYLRQYSYETDATRAVPDQFHQSLNTEFDKLFAQELQPARVRSSPAA